MSVKKALDSFSNFVTSLNEGVERVNRDLEMASEIQKACSGFELSFYAERTAITSALKQAESRLRFEDECAKNEGLAQAYEDIKASADKGVQDRASAKRPRSVTISPISAPADHPVPEVNESIQRAYQTMLKERSKFFNDARLRLAEDPRLRDKVKSFLESMDGRSYWEELSQHAK